MNIRYLLFISVGIERSYIAAGLYDGFHGAMYRLSEPSGSAICRRNILALASILVIAGVAGIDPYDFSIFSLGISEKRGLWVLGGAAFLAQLYWYAMRYYHLTEDGKVHGPRVDIKAPSAEIDITRKSTDLWANRAAASLAFLSWAFIVFWLFCSDA